MATLTNQTLLVMVGSYPRHKRATIPRQTRAPPTISLCHCPQNTSAGRVWLSGCILYCMETGCMGCMLQLYMDLSSSRLARHAIQPIQPIQLYSYTRYTAYSTIQRPSDTPQACPPRHPSPLLPRPPSLGEMPQTSRTREVQIDSTRPPSDVEPPRGPVRLCAPPPSTAQDPTRTPHHATWTMLAGRLAR